MAKREETGLSPKLHQLLVNRSIAKPRPTGVKSADVKMLLAAALGEKRVQGIPGDLAVTVVAGASDRELALEALGNLLRAGAGSTTRVTAAWELGRMATEGAEAALRDRVHDDDPQVQQAVFDALGRFAGEGALEDLMGVREPELPAPRRQLLFARALIAHRNGLKGPFLPDADRGAMVDQKSGQTKLRLEPSKGEGASDPKNVDGGTYGTELGPPDYEIVCGGNRWTLFLNREVAPKGIEPQSLFERPRIAGVLARWILEGRASVVQHVVLSRPDGDSVRLDVVRTDGTVMYTGTAERDADGLVFSIGHTKGPSVAPVHLEGTAGSKGIALTNAIALAQRVGAHRVVSALPS